ncbi:MAG: hypothetical protein KGL39_10780 [Patescibacteria group bacterium]|nr:hypothetical protein [Patescibacteria group bacterium]
MRPVTRRFAYCAGLTLAFLAGAYLARQEPAAGQVSGKALAWEYKVTNYDPEPGARAQSVAKELNGAAAAGWEFVGVYGPDKSLPLSVFRRHKQ